VSRAPLLAVAVALLLAATSLALPYFPVYDPWAWLVWGREFMGGSLETAAGPSWKPLPVLIDAPLSLLGDAAPKAWLLVARTGWFCAPLLAGLLAWRLSGEGAGRWRWVAAAVAGASVALTGDAFTPPLRQFTGGLSEPLLVALVLGAVWTALDERPGVALALGTAAALLRPECWPFLALYAFFSLRKSGDQDESRGGGKRSRLRLVILCIAVLIPVAWFVPDLIGAGTPLEGPETARAGGLEPFDAIEVLGRALAAPFAAVWIGVALLLWTGRIGIGRSSTHGPAPDRENDPPALDRPLAILLAGAGAWVLLVALMAIGGFAGLPRFVAPATAVVAIVGAVGIARAGASPFVPGTECALHLSRYATQRKGAPSGKPSMRVLAIVALVLAVAGFGWRVAQVPGDLEVVERQRSSLEDLFDLVDKTGSAPLLACSGTVKMTQVRLQTALAWKLEEPISSTPVRRKPLYGIALSTKPLPNGVPFANAGRWQATRLPCPSQGR
jgi:MFS family permease